MPMNPRTLRPGSTFTPRSISGLALWLDAADSSTLYTTDAGPVTAVSAPTEISGCVGWYDFSDSSSLTVTSGSIDACNDKSGNGFHLSASSTNRPTLASAVRNGLNAAEFDGVNDLMTATFSGTYTAATIFAVVYPDTAGGGSLGRILTRGASSLAYDGTNTALRYNAPFTGATGNGGQRTANGSAAQDQWHLASFTWNGGLNVATDITPYLSGVTSNAALTGTGDAVSTTGINDFILGNRSLADGADRGWDGYIGEIIIFNVALSAANRARVEAYLAAKWGISGVHAQATATNDPVGAWLDKSGNGLHVSQSSAASRPLAGTVGSRRAVDFDGSNDHLFTTTSATATGTFFCAHVLDTTSVAQSLYHMQSGTGASATRMHLLYSSTNEYRSQSVATGGVNIGVSGGVRTANPRIAVHTFSGTATGGRLDGAAMAGTTLATGSDQQGAWIGIRNLGGTLSLPLDGKVCEMLSYSRVLSAAEIARTERYLASKWNITLAPQVSNADAQDWINRVYAAGGTCSATTASAVNQFCVDIENAGIRDRFYRLNLFAGNSDASLNAVRTPLYRGPSLGGTQFGNTIDTNANFVAGDYAETGGSGGLLGNGSTKSLNTGLLPDDVFSASTGHLSYYGEQWTPTTTLNPGSCPLGCTNVAASQRFIFLARGNAGTCGGSTALAQGQLGSVAAGSQCQTGNDISSGMWMANRESATSGNLYKNGTQVGSNAVANAYSSFSEALRVFAYGYNGSPAGFAAVRMKAYSVGIGLTPAQAASYYAAMQAFQTALGRQV